MENLLKPDIGLMFWTLVTFLIMVVILKKIAWGPLLKALEDREAAIRGEIESARKGRLEMEGLKADYEKQLAGIEARTRQMLAEAEQKGARSREAVLKEAEREARAIADKTRQQLEAEKERLVRELRSQVGDLSVGIAEKLLRQAVDKKLQDKFIRDFVKDLDSRDRASR
ncbi:MAG: ATP synthase F0 subunit B [Elusimicrobia bacterium RIFCSPHIGHO2_01_FULL_64_10]|nr:MAG: ATP synthase F0 subunit B [Elusimicrobia bacterium RIFCSPHIGHO2_01_FULL_64_10]